MALTAAGPLGRWLWAADVANLFRPYLALASLMVLVLCLSARRPALVAVAAAALSGEIALLLTPALAGEALPRGRGGGGATLTVVSFNCLTSNPDPRPFLAWVRAVKPDIMVLEELPYGWRGRLATLHDLLPYRASQQQRGAVETDVFSRRPIVAASTYRPLASARTLVWAVIPVDGVALQVFGIHPDTLQTPSEWLERNAALGLAGQWVRDSAKGRATLVAGDWNTPPWSPYFGDFLRSAGVRSADATSWPAVTRVLGAPLGVRIGSSIDHIAASASFRALGCRTGPQLGSDHAPQLCRLQLVGANGA